MAVLETIQIGNPILRAKNHNLADFNDPKLEILIQNLRDSMHDMGLIGLAAPQLAQNLRVFITEPRETELRPADQADEFRVYINPEIVEISDDQTVLYEGCGSIARAQILGPVERPRIITIRAQDLRGNQFEFTADGILGRVIQHEYDHLEGVLFTDKLTDVTKLTSFENYRIRIKPQQWHIDNSKITVKRLER